MLVIIIYAVIILPIMVVCIYLGQLIARGEGDSLIAGYNTAKKEERERYDIGRLRRLSSMAMYATAALLPLFGVASTLPGQWAKVAILALAAILCVGTIVCITWGGVPTPSPLVVAVRGCSLAAAPGLLVAVASLVAEHERQVRGLQQVLGSVVVTLGL